MLNIVLTSQAVDNNNTVHQIVAIPRKIHKTDHSTLGWSKSSRSEDITGSSHESSDAKLVGDIVHH